MLKDPLSLLHPWEVVGCREWLGGEERKEKKVSLSV